MEIVIILGAIELGFVVSEGVCRDGKLPGNVLATQTTGRHYPDAYPHDSGCSRTEIASVAGRVMTR